jgi:hypothetical protein
MKRALIACVIAATAGASAPVTVAAIAPPPPRAQLEAFACHRAPNALDRWITVTAVMRPVSGTQRMALKLDLQRKPAHSDSFVNVHGGDLGQWRYPDSPPTLGQRPDDVWRLTKDVVNMAGPAVYRYRVEFRWTGTGGRMLDDMVRLSPRCGQPK